MVKMNGLEKVYCENCMKLFVPDDENDIYCCEECLDEAEGADDMDDDE